MNDHGLGRDGLGGLGHRVTLQVWVFPVPSEIGHEGGKNKARKRNIKSWRKKGNGNQI